MQQWEYRALACPAVIEAIGQALDQMGNGGWEFCGRFDTVLSVPEAPRDLRGESGPVLLGQARQAAQQTMPGHYLIFKRPKEAALFDAAEPAAEAPS